MLTWLDLSVWEEELEVHLPKDAHTITVAVYDADSALGVQKAYDTHMLLVQCSGLL